MWEKGEKVIHIIPQQYNNKCVESVDLTFTFVTVNYSIRFRTMVFSNKECIKKFSVLLCPQY
jgi:hypothetical protein